MARTRRHWHLAGKEPISNLAAEFGLQPSLIHGWVKQVLAQAERAFDRPSSTLGGGSSRSSCAMKDSYCCRSSFGNAGSYGAMNKLYQSCA